MIFLKQNLQLRRQLLKLETNSKDLKQIQGKLSNPNFTERAPAEIVQENFERKDFLRKKLEQLQEMLQNLS